MLKCQKNKLWLENIGNLFCSFHIIPFENMSLSEQMNAVTRLIIIIFIILLLSGFKHSVIFLILALLIIVIVYYTQKKPVENFTHRRNNAEMYEHKSDKKLYATDNTGTDDMYIDTRNDRLSFDNQTSKRFCNDERLLDSADGIPGSFNNPEWMSVNQKLAGQPNPKTKIPPVIIAPLADLSYWKANNMVIHSAINDTSQIDVYQSGYQVSTTCAPTYDGWETTKLAIPTNIKKSSVPEIPSQTIENFEHSKKLEYPSYSHNTSVLPNESGQVNVACGYNPDQLYRAGLPTNISVGNCQQDPGMKQFNDNLYTQTIQPGVYTRSQINEPINSNIGISFTQQFPPTTHTTNTWSGVVNYTEHDPRIMDPTIMDPVSNECTNTPITQSNIYDPRFTGYGTSYRSYTDDNTGQTRFYYDDIDAIKMPNYIVRSNIDNQPFADQYGPINEGNEYGNTSTPNIHALAGDAFMTSAIQHRNDIMERVMRKSNARAWQQRSAPISTTNQRMLGGMGCMNM